MVKVDPERTRPAEDEAVKPKPDRDTPAENRRWRGVLLGAIGVVIVVGLFGAAIVKIGNFGRGTTSPHPSAAAEPRDGLTPSPMRGGATAEEIENLRSARTHLGVVLATACADPNARLENAGPNTLTWASSEAVLAVERYNEALRAYPGAMEQSPPLLYRPVGLYTRAGGPVGYFTDRDGKVTRGPELDSPNKPADLDWCRSLGEFNTAAPIPSGPLPPPGVR